MRILVHEFVSGGGLAGRDVPASLAVEGAAMLTALLADLAVIRDVRLVTTADARFALDVPRHVDVVTLFPRPARRSNYLDPLIALVDAVWLIAPETGRTLERLAAGVEKMGRRLVGPGSAAIRRASDKARLPRLLARHGVAHPETRVVRIAPGGSRAATDAAAMVAGELGFPVVVKPARGAGCEAVRLARNARELREAVEFARSLRIAPSLVVQRYVRGTAASVSLISDGCHAVALSTNGQVMHASGAFSYRGGTTPLDHPLAGEAADAAIRACEAVSGLRGYVGVDLVLTRTEAVVIEVNPRLTTAYLGVRAAMNPGAPRDGKDGNVAAMALAACRGILPTPPRLRRRVRFTSGGAIVVTPGSAS